MLKHSSVALLVALSVCLLGTWRLDVHSMEGIIALGADHMLRTGEFFVPRLYGSVYAYKPALAYWLAAASHLTLGRSEFALRLPTALCGAVLVLTAFWTVARLVSMRCGLYVALGMSTSILFVEQGRIAGFDMPLALGIGLFILGACRNLVLRAPSLGWWLLAYLGLVFGFLAKGLPALAMVGPALLIAAWALRGFRQLLSWQHLLPLLVAGAVIAGYLWLAWLEAGPAAFQNQWGEASYRAGSWDLEALGGALARPLAIWIVFLPASALLPLLLSRTRPVIPPQPRRLGRAFWCFLLPGICVWMLIPAVSSRYYLPLITPISGLAALAAEQFSPNPFESAGTTGPERVHRSVRAWVQFTWVNYRPGVVVTLAGLALWIAYAVVLQPVKVAERSERSIASAFAPHLPPDETVLVALEDSGSSLFYYLDHPVRRWYLDEPPAAPSFFAVLTDAQISVLRARAGLSLQVLERRQTAGGRPWVLARIANVEGRRSYKL